MTARWLALIPVALFAALAGFFLSGLLRDDPDTLQSVMVGREAPPLQLTELPGKLPLTDAALRDGEVKLVNFWASWCVPCRAEHAQLEALAETVPVYGVNYKDTPGPALAFLEELGDPFAALGADAGRTGLDWGLYGVPETFVIDGDGVVRLRFAGPITRSAMADTILPAVEAARE
ncbi:DsbE family thiol:disulfide interchange protein [Jannaschia sp. W003]|uniref:DsbE family thiol:disulfide interchange protein n=1 Tax=Jannaschia sp. W003 TaxID=2867012 RepID=UPI0021A6A210|nr:DsbE family thiol:disulfide interchange protein [Jannaschia sp. W003]UWQ20983.1 DsbE family thiol:disulfide interchange protein [Jannaschia sp. W003]